jgi:GTPase SAR1 family protein
MKRKIVYFGAPASGKSASIQALQGFVGPLAKPTENGFSVELSLPRKATLEVEVVEKFLAGADAIVFVVSSSPQMRMPNENALSDLDDFLSTHDGVPVVFQYNSRDLFDAQAVSDLDIYVRPGAYPVFQTVAPAGRGVRSAFKAALLAASKGLSAEFALLQDTQFMLDLGSEGEALLEASRTEASRPDEPEIKPYIPKPKH